MTHGKVIVFNENISDDLFITSASDNFRIDWQGEKSENLFFLDSFDGRLFRAGYIFVHSNLHLKLVSYLNTIEMIQISWRKKAPAAADQLPSEIRENISGFLGVRALMIKLSVDLSSKDFTVFNADQKIIAHGRWVESRESGKRNGPVKTFCFIDPLRGYSAEVDKLTAGWPGFETYPVFENALLKLYNTDLTDYSKPDFKFTEDHGMAAAIKEILQQSFDIMRKNEQGIISDIDTEFLHDFRVSGRRMRSVFSLLKGVLDPEMTAKLVNDLKTIGKFSGPLRDLDVYLLRENEYKNLLPADWDTDTIHTLFVTLKKRRNLALRNMRAFLQSGEYSDMTARWEVFFENYENFVVNDPPLTETASALILGHYKKVVKRGKKLTVTSPDEKFHNLRIVCKKLRYLIEFFSSLYPQEAVNDAIKQLKALQDNLGDFNDLSVQIDQLYAYLNNLKSSDNSLLIREISALIAVLNYKKILLRQAFKGLFKKFISKKNENLFYTLFGQK